MKRPRLLVVACNSAATTAGRVSAINVALGTAAEDWSTIRYGVYPNAVGVQVFDREAADAIVAAANSARSRVANTFRGEPIYVGHPDEPSWAKENPTVRMEAVGRMPEFQATDAGLKIRHAWNDEGKRLVGGPAPVFDSYSPRWGMVPITYQGRQAFRPVELYSIGLTNRPNIPGTMIGLNEALPAPLVSENQNKTPMKELIIKLLAALGQTVAADTPDDQIAGLVEKGLTAAKAMKPASEVTAANERATLAETKLTAANGQVTAAVNEAAGLRTSLATERAARAGVVVTTAVNEGRLTEAQRSEWVGKFTADKADFAVVEGELKKLKVSINTKTKVEGLGTRRGAAPGDQSKVTAVNEAINAKMKATNCTRLEAANALRAEGNALFVSAAE